MRRRVQADPASIAFAALAEEFRRLGRYDEAIETCRAGLVRHPAYLSARVTLGRALIEAGDFEGAREELETVLRSAPENLAAIRGLAQIHERLGHSTEMDPALAKIVESMPARPPAPPAPPPPEPAEPVAPVIPEPVVLAPEPVALPPEPVVPPVPEPVAVAPEPVALTVPEPITDPIEPEELFADYAVVDAPDVDLGPSDLPDPAVTATLARLEHFLTAIQLARHA
ncbi:MAG TPA: tetratricopeptide repeat protein [Vicinamibacterales bacterium]|nr:tetratricopeptide repeat protein [Vicinamibacterales bacterium]